MARKKQINKRAKGRVSKADHPRKYQSKPTHSRTSSPSEPKPKPELLSLPPELRIYIYELALKSERSVILEEGMDLPPLLSTRREIQNEAYPVWLSANTFIHTVWHCNDRFLHGFAPMAKRYNKNPPVKIYLLEQANWRNLLVWCRHVWEGESITYKKHGSRKWLQTVANTAHRIVEKYSRESWDDCRQALEAMAAHADGEWVMREKFGNASKSVAK